MSRPVPIWVGVDRTVSPIVGVGVDVAVGVLVGNNAIAVAVADSSFLALLAGRNQNHHTATPTTARKASAQGTMLTQ